MRRRHIALVVLGLVAVAAASCGGDDKATENAGQAGVAGQAGRVVEIRQLDSHRFEPSTIEVEPGQTITFKVTNAGTEIHEFFIGNEADHDKRDSEMKAMGPSPMEMADRPNTITVQPGTTEELTWTFPQKGVVEFACHEPGHYGHGMKGTVKVK